MYFALCSLNLKKMSMAERCTAAIERLYKRTYFHEVLYKFAKVCYERNFQMILENPCAPVNYLVTGQNFITPSVIDKNRRVRGDYFIKPTAYWFLNCEPTHGMSLQKPKEEKRIEEHSNPSGQAYIAQSPNGKWDYGYLAYYDDGGVVCPVMLQKGDKGLSEEKAREQALKAIESNVRLTQVTDIEGRSRLLDIIWNEMNSK